MDAISTGVQGSNISIWNARRTVYSGGSDWRTTDPYVADVSNGVYALFNDKGYVIAAITVGEDDSASTQYAWVSSEKMDYEGYADGKWTYAREVIIDGKVTTLTEVETDGETAADIKTNLPTGDDSYVWEVKLKADGTVKSVTTITDWSDSSDNTDKFIDDITYREGNTNGTIVMDYAPVVGDGPWTVRYTGNTLHVETKLDSTYRGFPVAYDANIIVVKDEQIYRDNAGIAEYNYKADISETFANNKDGDGLKRAVNSLNNNKDFKGHIVAIFKDGVATSVILYDQTETEVDINNRPGNAKGIIDVAYDGDKTVDITYEGSVPTGMDIRLAIIDVLKAERGVANVKSVKLGGTAPSYSFEATLELTDGDSAVIESGVVNLINDMVSSDSIDDAMDEALEDTGFTPNGDIAVKGNVITLTYSAAADNVNGPKLMTDLSHFLGGLYTSGKVTKNIKFDGKTYTWKGDDLDAFLGVAAGTNTAYSRWATGTSGHGTTLVADLVDAQQGSGSPVALNGLEFTLTLDGVDFTVKVVSPTA